MRQVFSSVLRFFCEFDVRRLGALAVLALGTVPVVFGICPGYWCAQPAQSSQSLVDVTADIAPAVDFASAGEQARVADSSASSDQRAVRQLYPYSVVPGGVENAAEIRAAESRDEAVRAHYAGFNVANAHPAQLSEAKLVYVSYRRGDRIFWTKNPTRLAKGERVITDGAAMLRARCGNRISEVPMAPVEALAPGAPVAPEAMELPAGEAAPVTLATPTDVPMVATPETAMLVPPVVPTVGPPSWPSGPGIYAPPYFIGPEGSTPVKPTPPSGPGIPSGPGAPSGPGSPSGPGAPGTPSGPAGPGVPGQPPIAAPEPGELAMMILGIAGVVVALRGRKRGV
jgi:hypothetical protein